MLDRTFADFHGLFIGKPEVVYLEKGYKNQSLDFSRRGARHERSYMLFRISAINIKLRHMPSASEKDDPSRTTPIGLLRFGAEFMEAALAADEKMGHKKGHEIIAPVPVMFLVGQAIELALKSFLLAKGVELTKLRFKYGHDLHRCLKKAKELGLLNDVPLHADEENAIEILNPLYASKQLQYIETGPKTFPVFGPLERAAVRLLKGVGAQVGYEPRGLPNVL